MNKYWYFVSIVMLGNEPIYYKGYVVSNKGVFPIKTAELQSIDYVIIEKRFTHQFDKNSLLEKTFIVNHIETDEKKFETWKVTMKF